MSQAHTASTTLWLLLAAGPLLFHAAFSALSIAFAVGGSDPSAIAAKVSALVPHSLLAVLACLGVGTLSMRDEETLYRGIALPVLEASLGPSLRSPYPALPSAGFVGQAGSGTCC